MLCARFPPSAPILRGPSLMAPVLQRGTAGRVAVSTVPHRSRRLARERERQLKKVVSSLSRDEVTGMQRQLRRRLQQEALLESKCVRTYVCCPVYLLASCTLVRGSGVRSERCCTTCLIATSPSTCSRHCPAHSESVEKTCCSGDDALHWVWFPRQCHYDHRCKLV